MPPSLCRNFQRGSCQYGDRCKFLHPATPTKPTTSSYSGGFGKQQHQQPNPFGFGGTRARNPQSINNSSNTPVTTAPPPKHNFKPFENKWSRFSQTTNAAAPAGNQPSRQPDNHPVSAADHKCTDPDTCKRQIIEDFEHERPLWKLTCYGHNKSAPCDIVGDMSCEELRAAAYNDAKHGLSLQSIVERERSLLNAKLLEFETLLRNPYVQKISSTTSQSNSPGFGPSATTPNNAPPSVSSFSQLGGSVNLGFGMRPDTSQSNAFGQKNSIQVTSQPHSGYGTNTLPFGSAGSFTGQHPNQPPQGNLFTSTTSSFSSSVISMEQNASFPLTASSQIQTLGSGQSPIFPMGSNSASVAVGIQPNEKGAVDNTIWLEEWKRGAVPEEAPPDKYIS